MERINEFVFYDIGKTLRALASVVGNSKPSAVFLEIVQAEAVVTGLLSGKPVKLGVSRKPAEELLKSIGNISSHFKDTEGNISYPEDDAVWIGSYWFDWYRNALAKFENVFSEEMAQAATYIVPARGIYDIPSLVDFADRAIPAEVSSFIPDNAKDDWRAAGRCLAFILPSASGFHVARAIESTVEAYYKAYLGTAPPTGQSWGDLVSDLEKVAQNPVPDPKTLAILRQIKDDWRNPVIHPRVTLTLTDAEVLFALGASVLMAVAQELKRLAENGVQPSLTFVARDGAVA